LDFCEAHPPFDSALLGGSSVGADVFEGLVHRHVGGHAFVYVLDRLLEVPALRQEVGAPGELVSDLIGVGRALPPLFVFELPRLVYDVLRNLLLHQVVEAAPLDLRHHYRFSCILVDARDLDLGEGITTIVAQEVLHGDLLLILIVLLLNIEGKAQVPAQVLLLEYV